MGLLDAHGFLRRSRVCSTLTGLLDARGFLRRRSGLIDVLGLANVDGFGFYTDRVYGRRV